MSSRPVDYAHILNLNGSWAKDTPIIRIDPRKSNVSFAAIEDGTNFDGAEYIQYLIDNKLIEYAVEPVADLFSLSGRNYLIEDYNVDSIVPYGMQSLRIDLNNHKLNFVGDSFVYTENGKTASELYFEDVFARTTKE